MTVMIDISQLPAQPTLGPRLKRYVLGVKGVRKGIGRKQFREASVLAGAPVEMTEGKLASIEGGRNLREGEAQAIAITLHHLGVPLDLVVYEPEVEDAASPHDQQTLPSPVPVEEPAPLPSPAAPASSPPVPETPQVQQVPETQHVPDDPVKAARLRILASHQNGDHAFQRAANCSACEQVYGTEVGRQDIMGQHAAGDHRLQAEPSCPACEATGALNLEPRDHSTDPPIDVIWQEELDARYDRSPFDVVEVEAPRSISQGQFAVYKRCKRKFWWGIYRGLVMNGREMSDARATGDRVHRALAAWYTADQRVRMSPMDALERAIIEDWTKLSVYWRDLLGEGWEEDPRVQTVAHKFNAANDLERAMVEGYVQWVAETGQDQGLVVVESERILHSDISLGDGRWMRLVGTLDARVIRESDGVRMFLEHKTRGDTSGQRGSLSMDEQVLTYHLLEYLTSKDGDQRCDGALYNVLRRVKRTERAKPPFYDRIEVPHSVHELEAMKKRIVGQARGMFDLIDQLDAGADPLEVAYPTPVKGRCEWDCDFFAICTMADDGSPVEDAIASLYHHEDPLARYYRIEE